MRSVGLRLAVAGLSWMVVSCGIIPLPAGPPTSTELGFTRIASKPGKHWQCQRLSVRGDVLAVMIGQSITLYRKKEGIFFYGMQNTAGMLPYQKQSWSEDPDACAKWNLADWRVSDARFYAFNHPYFIEVFDNAEADPPAFFDKIQHGPPYFSGTDIRDGEKTVSWNGREPADTSFQAIADRLQTLRASDLFRDMDLVRRILSPEGVAAAKAQRQASAQAAAQRRIAAAESARQTFLAAAARAKAVGMTVCSADNRMAYVEQAAGPRIKLTVRGRLLARERQFGELGPYDPVLSSYVVGSYEDPPVEDPYFLFHRLPGTIYLSTENKAVWDESRYWGECDYR